MTKKLWFAVFFLLVGNPLWAQDMPFKVGDRLTYELEILGMKAGTQTDEVIAIETKEKQAAYHLCSQITTNAFVSLFYKLFEKIDCWAATEDLLPISVLKDIQQGKHKKYYDLRFDHQKHQAVIIEGKDKTVADIPLKTFDPLSLIYYLRTQELKIGDTYKLGVLSTSQPKEVVIQVISEDKVSCPYGKFKALRVKQEPGRTTVWFTNDNQHLPVMIEVTTKAGKLKAKLVTQISHQPVYLK